MTTAPKMHPDVVETFQIPGPDVTHWTCARFAAGEDTSTKGERLAFETDGVSLQEWPIADLSVQALRDRWGSGIYRIGWLTVKGTKRTARGRSRAVQIGDVAPAASPAVVAAPPLHAMMAGMANPLAFMREIREMAREELATVDRGVENRIGALTQLAQVFVSAREVPAVDPGVAQALGQLGQGFQAIAATLENVNARLAALESDDGDDGDDDDEDEDEDEDAAEPDAIDRLVGQAERLAPVVMTVGSMIQAQREQAQRPREALPQAATVAPAPVVVQPAPSSTFEAMAAADAATGAA